MSLLDDVISGKRLGRGWEGLETLTSEVDAGKKFEAARKRYEDAYVLIAPFRTAEGQRSLAALKAMTQDAPTWDGENLDYQKAVSYGFVREGQNSIYRHLMICMQIVEQGPPTPPESKGGTN